MSFSANGQPPMIVNTLQQRMVVCDSSARWLGAIRGALDETQQRAIVPALDLQDAVGQSQEANQALVVVFVPSGNPQKAIEQIRQTRMARHVLLFAVCDPNMSPWRLALVEAGCARVFTSLLQLDALIESARQFFSEPTPFRSSWQEQILDRIPWSAWSTDKVEGPKPGSAG